MTAATTAAMRPAHHYLRNADTGHLLRLTRLGEGTKRRQVFLMTDTGAVELGSVVLVVGRVCMAYPAVSTVKAMTCDTFADGARQLDVALEVRPVTVYTVQARTTTLTPLDPHRIDADTTDTED